MTGRRRDKVGAAAAALLVALLALPSQAAGQVPPDRAWSTVETEHFRVTFPTGMEALGRLTADRAEAAWTALAAAFVAPAEGRIDVVVTDHADTSNGLAGVAPYRRVVIYARPPIDGFALSHYHDWLDLVLTHELAHVAHLDRVGGPGRLLRPVFGRVPTTWPFFPELATPRWVIEGMATFWESTLTPTGRVGGTHHAMILRTAVAEGHFDDVGEVSGDAPEWPGGNRAYVYGSMFFDWMRERHGPESMARFVDAVGGQWIPYRLNAAARDAFGESFGDAWDAWRGALEDDLAATRARVAAGPATPLETLTGGARMGFYPSVSPDGTRLAWIQSDGRSDSQLRVAALDGSGARKLARVNGAAVFGWTPSGDVVLSELEYTDPYSAYADLWRVDRDGGRRRMTRELRLDHPAPAPDGRIVAVRTEGGRAWLVELDPAVPDEAGVRRLTEPRLDEAWGFPAVSPDGRWIAAVRWERGATSDLFVLDRDGREVARLTRDLALDLAPAWAPDGTLLWGSDRTGIPDLYAVVVDVGSGRPAGPVRQVTNVLSGVAFPSVDPAGRWIHLSLYTAEGWEVARLPYDPSAWFEPMAADPALAAPRVAARGAAGADGDGWASLSTVDDGAPVQPYAPWKTFRPTYWEPLYEPGEDVLVPGGGDVEVLGPGVGFATTATDVVGRHALGAAVTWSLTGGRPDGGVAYRYAGLGNPVLGVTVEQSWDAAGPLLGARETGPPDTLFLREREREVTLSAELIGRRVRSYRGLTLSGSMVWERRELLDRSLEPSADFALNRPSTRLADLGASAVFTTARGHPYGMGLDQGVSLSARGRWRSELDVPDTLAGLPGSDRGYREAVAVARAYRGLPLGGFADHVLALRVAGGVAAGPGADQFHFDVGGAGGQRETFTGLGLFGGSGYTFPVRGYPNGARYGRRAWSASAEYRVPVAVLDRPLGLFPLYLDRVGASLFGDVGNAWGPELGERLYDNPRRGALASAGAEVTVRAQLLFSATSDVRMGVAVPFVDGYDPAFYLRLGLPF